MFNLAIDSKLRGCDVVALKVEDVAPNGYSVDRATVRQKKTGRPVRFELTEQTRQAVDGYITAAGKKLGEFLFTASLSRDHFAHTLLQSSRCEYCGWRRARTARSHAGNERDELAPLQLHTLPVATESVTALTHWCGSSQGLAAL
jgi:integrase